MVTARIYSEAGRIIGFHISGHAGKQRHGRNIVCAAVSAVAYTAIGAIDSIVREQEYTESEGELRFILRKPDDGKLLEKAYTILETMKIGLLQIQREHPGMIEVETREGMK